MRALSIFLLLNIISLFSLAQSQAGLVYIDNGNLNEQNAQLFTYQKNSYIVSSTETAQFSNQYLISLTKTEQNGNILWTKYYFPGGVQFSNFTTNKVQFKDSTILIYGICRDEINRVRKFFIVLNSNGIELYSKIFPFTTIVTQFHASLNDSSTVECVYYDFEQSRLLRYEKFNRIGELIQTDSIVNTLKTSIFRAFNNFVYAIDLVENQNHKLEVKLFQFDNTLTFMDSTILTTTIPIFTTSFKTFGYANVGISLDSNALFVEGLYDFNAIDLDSYFIRINLPSKQLLEYYYSKKNNTNQYQVIPESIKYIRFKGSVYCLQKNSLRDSSLKTTILLSKIKNGNLEWSREVYQSTDPTDSINIQSISLDTFGNKILTTMNFVQKNKLWMKIHINYIDGSYHYDFEEPLDTFSNPSAVIKTVYSDYNILNTLGITHRGISSDMDLLWKTWHLDVFGSTNLTNASKIKIYPNPAKDYVTISGVEILEGPLECIDLLGIKHYVKKANNQINTSNLLPGLYLLFIDGKYLRLIISKQ